MAKLTEEQWRLLRILENHPLGCPEAMLLDQGFTVGQLGQLILARFAKLRADGRQQGFLLKITQSGRKAIASRSTE
jgi:hypothetical protein